jgi:hypothetical protein
MKILLTILIMVGGLVGGIGIIFLLGLIGLWFEKIHKKIRFKKWVQIIEKILSIIGKSIFPIMFIALIGLMFISIYASL